MIDVVFCGTGWFTIVDYIRARLPAGVSIRIRDFDRPITEELATANVILPSNARIDAAAIHAPRDLRLIQQPAVGVEWIDLEAARLRGVPVCNAAGSNEQAVAEAALLLLLSLARRVPAARRAFASATIGEPVGTELAGKTLGLVGRGRSGTRLAHLATALGMKVLSVRSTSSRTDFFTMLAASDFVSIHCPLTAATKDLFDSSAFAAMKPGACLVNCARGGIIDRAALEAALASHKLAGVGLDVFWQEPWDPNDPLFSDERVVVLPHIAGSSDASFTAISTVVAENIRRVLAGQEPLPGTRVA
jgi:phosphoglycerate dehydrogenase-like enzyme